MSPVLARSRPEHMRRHVRSWRKLTCEPAERGSGYDPSATLAVHCGNGFDARFEPLSKYSFEPIQCWHLSLGADMRRREFISLLGGAAVAWPLAARAQHPGGMRRIGVLMQYVESDHEAQRSRQGARRRAAKKLGWIKDRNLRLDYRWVGTDSNGFQRHAADLVRLKEDGHCRSVIAAVRALRRGNTNPIPIVFNTGVRSGRPRHRQTMPKAGRQHHWVHELRSGMLAENGSDCYKELGAKRREGSRASVDPERALRGTYMRAI